MGCFDVYCLLCGNPCIGASKSVINEFIGSKDADQIRKFIRYTEWMNICMFLTVTNEVVEDVKDITCAATFKGRGATKYYYSDDNINKHEIHQNYGIKKCIYVNHLLMAIN